MLERSEASQKSRAYHPNCRGGVGPPKKRRKITKQQDLSCWNEVKHLKNHETVILTVGAVPTCPPEKRRKITKQQDLSCWNVAKHLKNYEIVIHAIGAGSAHPKNDAR